MDERIVNIVNNIDSLKIGLDEPFKFHCTMCGNCCLNREDILLSPKDIYNMSKELGVEPVDFFKKYCETYIGDSSRVPVVRLEPIGTSKKCPLLENQKCRVHRAKPVVCAMFPIGRCLIRIDAKEGFNDIRQDQVQYIFNNPGCGDDSETHTVREWLEAFNVPVQDEYFLEWQQTILKMSIICRAVEKAVDQEVMEDFWKAAFVKIYLAYKTENSFLPQFELNVRKFLDKFNGLL